MVYFVTMLFHQKPKTYPNWTNWKPKTYPSLNQSEYSLKPIHFIQAQPIRDPVNSFLGDFVCPWLVCISYPSMNAWVSPTACTCTPVFENKPHLWEQDFLLDLTRHSTLHTGLSAWPYMTLVYTQPFCMTTASCSPHHCITTMIFLHYSYLDP